MKCVLCGNSHFREDEDGLWCRNCGASMSGPPSDNWSPFFSGLDAERAEDEAALRDMQAAEGIGYRDRSFGG